VIPCLRLVLAFALCLTAAIHSHDARAATADPDKDSEAPKLLEDARTLIDGKKPQAAIEKCEKVIALFKAHYANTKEKIYCARSSAESLGYLLKAAADKQNAIALSATWADAYFIKSYALQELGRMAEAKLTAQRAVELSPWSSHYLSELGNIYALEKNWANAKETFEIAEEHAPLSPDSAKATELGRARRGIAYVLVELGRLDEAEKKYQQCLKENPNDTKAAEELEYVRSLKAKSKSK